jgi:hypothetical protein
MQLSRHPEERRNFVPEDERDAECNSEDERDADFIAEDERDADFIPEDERDVDFIAEDERDADFIAEDDRDTEFIPESDVDADTGGLVHLSLGVRGPVVAPLGTPSMHTKPLTAAKKKKRKKKAGGARGGAGPDRVYPPGPPLPGGSAVRVAQWRRLRRDKASREAQAQHMGLASKVVKNYRPGSAAPGPVRTAAATAAAAFTLFAVPATGSGSAAGCAGAAGGCGSSGPRLRSGEARALGLPLAEPPGPWTRSSDAEHAWAANQGPPLQSPPASPPYRPTYRPLEDKSARAGLCGTAGAGSAAGPARFVELVGVRAVAVTGKWRHAAMHMGISRTSRAPPGLENPDPPSAKAGSQSVRVKAGRLPAASASMFAATAVTPATPAEVATKAPAVNAATGAAQNCKASSST